MRFEGFPPETLQFLRQLAKNNNREWFMAHKPVYETKVKGPMIELLRALQPELKRFAPEIVYDPARSIFRIYRDIRFSADKSPYKTHISAYMSPAAPSRVEKAGLYLHLEPARLLIAGGLYRPPAPALRAVRHHIVDNEAAVRRILRSREFVRLFGELGGEMLSRTPRGFPADHSAADLLRHKDFIVTVERPARFAESRELLPLAAKHFKAMMPLIRFLNEALLTVQNGLIVE